jgi:methionine-gamma-lyase
MAHSEGEPPDGATLGSPISGDTVVEEAPMNQDGANVRPESAMMGFAHDARRTEGAVKVPLYQTSTFEFESAAEGRAFFARLADTTSGRPAGYVYSRLGNPNLTVAEERLRLWDGADRALLFTSGMAAISTTLLALVRPGDVLLHSHPLYGCTDYVVRHFLPEFGVTPVAIAPDMGPGDIRAAVDEAAPQGRPAMIFVETPANPTLDLFDMEMLAGFAGSWADGTRRPLLTVDNTFLGPMWQRPLDHGADLVVYSATKYIGGHSDLVAGAVLGSAANIAPIALLRGELGTTASPETAWLITRSLETLHVRTERQLENARRIAAFLREHPKVGHLRYLEDLEPGSRQYDIYKRQCLSPGAMLAFEVDGGEPAAYRFLDSLELVKLAVSLGSTESLAEHPGSMTHAGVDDDVRLRLGITPGFVRLSVGIEATDDLIADLSRALTRV